MGALAPMSHLCKSVSQVQLRSVRTIERMLWAITAGMPSHREARQRLTHAALLL